MDTYVIFVNLLVALAVCYSVYFFLQFFSSEVEEAKKAKEQKAGGLLSELYIALSPEAFFMLRLSVAVFLFFASAILFSGVLGIVLGLFGYMYPYILLRRLRARRVQKLEEQLVDGLELLGNCLRSGMTLQQSVALLVEEFPPPISQEFKLVLAETRLGSDFNDALESMAERLDSNVVSILASGVAVVKRCGGDLTDIFQNISSTIREQASLDGKLNAVTAQGRFQGFVLSVMPFALIVILWFVDPSHIDTLFGNDYGVWAVIAVIAMVFVAQLWIKKLLTIDV